MAKKKTSKKKIKAEAEDDDDAYYMNNEPSPISFLEFETHNEFRSLREYVIETSQLIKREGDKLEAEFVKESEQYRHDDRSLEAIAAHYVFDIIRFHDTYSEILLHNTFVGTVSMFESTLKKICAVFYEKFELKVDDLKSNGNVDGYSKYLQKVVGIDLSEFEEKLKEIQLYFKVRNAIVHNDSDIQKDSSRPLNKNSDVYKFLISSGGIGFRRESSRLIITDPKFILKFIDKGEDYLDLLLKKLSNLKSEKTGYSDGR